MLLWTRVSRFSLKHNLHVEVRFTSDDLSLVIFRQPTEPPLKILKLRSWLRQILKHSGLQLISGFPRLDWWSFEMLWAWSSLNCGLCECTVELLKASRKGCLRNSVQHLSWAPVCWLVSYWTSRVVGKFCQYTVELITEAGTYSLYVRERSPHKHGCHADQVETRTSMKLRCDSQLLWRHGS